MATVRALSNAVEARDAYTGKHAERVAAYGLELARARGARRRRRPQLEFGFLLHDVGKVAVPDAILFKTGPLTDEEYALIARIRSSARRSCATSTSSATASTSSATTTSAGTAPAIPTGLAGEDDPARRRACSRSPTRSTRSRPTAPTAPRSAGTSPATIIRDARRHPVRSRGRRGLRDDRRRRSSPPRRERALTWRGRS